MSAVKVLKSLLLGMLTILIQHFYWKKVLYECLSPYGKNGLTMQCFIYCTMLILVFCVMEGYLILYKDYNWKERLPLDLIWVICIILYYSYAHQMVDKYVRLPLEEDENWFYDWDTADDLYGYTGISVYGIYLLISYVVMRVGFIYIKEIKKWKKTE